MAALLMLCPKKSANSSRIYKSKWTKEVRWYLTKIFDAFKELMFVNIHQYNFYLYKKSSRILLNDSSSLWHYHDCHQLNTRLNDIVNLSFIWSLLQQNRSYSYLRVYENVYDIYIFFGLNKWWFIYLSICTLSEIVLHLRQLCLFKSLLLTEGWIGCKGRVSIPYW